MKYQVMIKVTAFKTYMIEADSPQAASRQAEEFFSILDDGMDEHCKQEVVDVTLIPERAQ